MLKLLKKPLIAGLMILAGAITAAKLPDMDNSSFKNEFLARINKTRAQGCRCGTTYMPPAPPLVWNDQLEDAAKGHAKDMDKRDYFDHTSKDGRSIEDRIFDAGYDYNGYKSFAIGENIAKGQESIAEVHVGWFKSPGHCKNLMNPAFKEVGIAERNSYWVQDFGGREAFTDQEKKLIKSGKLIIKRRKSVD